MREIKFRCWNKTKEKTYFDTAIMEQQYMDSGYMTYFGLFDAYTTEKDYIVMQYTELKDKNGKEIYEGDLCRCGDVFRQVVFKDGGFKVTGVSKMYNAFYELNNIDYGTTDLEIIGNIYENPELLK